VDYNVVGVRFKKAGKIYYFDPGDLELNKGEGVIVETARGIEYGDVVVGPLLVDENEVVAPLKRVIRKATPEDLQVLEANKEKEKRAFQICVEKIALHKLPMKLIGVEQTFDGNKIIFYFTAEGRIDFRELVKDLAAVFRTRIELRQIGVRDEAKMVGGLGCCGRELCCATWLSDFASVSIKMAKEQNLSLNPTKISGVCGRLMCCLKYENEVYETAKEGFPSTGSWVTTPDGEGKVVGSNIFRNKVSVELKESKLIKEYPCEEIVPRADQVNSCHCCQQENQEPQGEENV
jgi:cell fate regulator YaaT (PSP1 superfamily)